MRTQHREHPHTPTHAQSTHNAQRIEDITDYNILIKLSPGIIKSFQCCRVYAVLELEVHWIRLQTSLDHFGVCREADLRTLSGTRSDTHRPF